MDILSATVMLTLIMDPFGNMPVFHAVLKGVAPQRRRVIIAREAVIALGILLAFLWAGRPIMSFLNLRPPTLNISGGIILFVIALRMVFPRQETEPAGLDDRTGHRAAGRAVDRRSGRHRPARHASPWLTRRRNA